MPFDGVERDARAAADGLVAQALGEQAENLEFTLGERFAAPTVKKSAEPASTMEETADEAPQGELDAVNAA